MTTQNNLALCSACARITTEKYIIIFIVLWFLILLFIDVHYRNKWQICYCHYSQVFRLILEWPEFLCQHIVYNWQRKQQKLSPNLDAVLSQESLSVCKDSTSKSVGMLQPEFSKKLLWRTLLALGEMPFFKAKLWYESETLVSESSIIIWETSRLIPACETSEKSAWHVKMNASSSFPLLAHGILATGTLGPEISSRSVCLPVFAWFIPLNLCLAPLSVH